MRKGNNISALRKRSDAFAWKALLEAQRAEHVARAATAPNDDATERRLEHLMLQALRQLKTGVSFVELERAAEREQISIAGNNAIGTEKTVAKNIYFWFGVSDAFERAFARIVKARLVKIKPTSPLVYFIDGATLSVPVARQVRAYKRPRWMPVSFDYTGPESDADEGRAS